MAPFTTTWCQPSSIETLKEGISAPLCHSACGALLWQHWTIIFEQRSMILQEVPKNVAIACGSKRVNGRVLTYTKEEPRVIWGAYFREWCIKDTSWSLEGRPSCYKEAEGTCNFFLHWYGINSSVILRREALASSQKNVEVLGWLFNVYNENERTVRN